MPYYEMRALAAPLLINDSGGGYMVILNGAPVTVVAGTLSIQCAVGRRSTATFTVYTHSLTTHYQQYQQVAIYDSSSVLVFSGYVSSPKEVKPGFPSSLLTSITCIDQHFLADKRVVATVYANQTPAQIVTQLVSTILASEGVTIGQVYDPSPALFCSLTTLCNTTTIVTQSSNAIPSATFGYCTVAAALDALVTAASSSGIPYYWQIDQLKRLYFVPYTLITGPALTGALIDQVQQAPSVTRANPTYRNTQYLTGGVAQTVQQIENRLGDGTTTAWAMGYALALPPVITVNGGLKAVGVKGATGFQYYWQQGDPTISQDSGEPKLSLSDTLTVTYVGQFPTVVVVTNTAQITYEAGLDGTTGIIEEVEADATVTSLTAGYQEAGNLLTRYATQGIQLQCTVKQAGFVQGQSIAVSLPMFGLTTTMLLESVTITDSLDAYNLWYQLNLVSGPYDTTWEAFFGNLISTAQPMSNVTVGSSQSLALLANFTGAFTPAATYTATVFACPITSASTFCNTTTIVC